MPPQRRVLHIVRRFAPLVGGTERLVLDLALAQAARGNDVTVLTANRDVSGVRGELIAAQDAAGPVRVVRIPVIGSARWTIALRPDVIVSEIRRADVVHHHDLRFMTAIIATASRLLHRPLYVHTHGLFFHTPFARAAKRMLLRYYYAPILALCRAGVIASSEPDRRILAEFSLELASRTVTVENGLDLRSFLELPRAPTPGLIVAPGRVVSSKGLDDLFRALSLLPDAGWILDVLGDEDRSERERLEALRHELGLGDRVRFKGRFERSQLLSTLSTASLAVFPSRAEGFGLALLEALAAGTPVLARDIPAHRSVLGPTLMGRIVDFADARDGAAAIRQSLVMDTSSELETAIVERRRARTFDIAGVAEAIEALYDLPRRPSDSAFR